MTENGARCCTNAPVATLSSESVTGDDEQEQEPEDDSPEAKMRGPTVIIQRYIDKPLLIHRRKFDFRIFALFTSVNKRVKGYFYEDGYIRTSSREFNLDNLSDRFIHLTNDAI